MELQTERQAHKQASKERRFNISKLTADDLNGLMITILQHGLFKSPVKERAGKR